MSLDQLYLARPLPFLSNYRSPIKGLYLCGSGCHPGLLLTLDPQIIIELKLKMRLLSGCSQKRCVVQCLKSTANEPLCNVRWLIHLHRMRQTNFYPFSLLNVCFRWWSDGFSWLECCAQCHGWPKTTLKHTTRQNLLYDLCGFNWFKQLPLTLPICK